MLAQSKGQEKNTYAQPYFLTSPLRRVLGVDVHGLHNLAKYGVAIASRGHGRSRQGGPLREWPAVDACTLAVKAALWRLTGRQRWSSEAVNRALCVAEGRGLVVPADIPLAAHFRAVAQAIVDDAAARNDLPELYRAGDPTAPVWIAAVLRDPASEPSFHIGALDDAPPRSGLIAANVTETVGRTLEALGAET